MAQTFTKSERLHGQKNFDQITKSGASFFSYPFRVVWVESESNEAFPAQLGIAVPKRLFKRAVKRNLIRRRIREAYRKNKEAFYLGLNERNKHIHVLLIFTHREVLEYAELEGKIILTLQRLLKACDAHQRERKTKSRP